MTTAPGKTSKGESLAQQQQAQREMAAALQRIHVTANSTLVSRTQRVVRERALEMQARRRRTRDLWLACTICSAWLIMMTHSAWSGFMQSEASMLGSLQPVDLLESSAQMLVMAMWFLPVSVVVLMMVWFKRNRDRSDNERLDPKSYRAINRVQIAR